MSNPVTVKIKGIEELKAELERRYGQKQLNLAIRQALSKGAGIFKKAAAAEAPKASGLLSKHFKVKYMSRKQKAIIGATSDAVYPGKDRPFIKGGAPLPRTAANILKRLEMGSHRVPANPFFTRVYESRKAQAFDAVIEKLKEWLFKR
jgi:HK97 gp10 family phage protein